MSRTGALDDSEMQGEMNKMVAFISQEAREKAREIQVKADEEFAIEKAKIVRQESAAIDAQFEKKQKQAEVGWKIAQSTALNTSRLQVLRVREDLLQQLFDEAKKQLKELKDDKEKYEGVVESLIVEVLLGLLAPTITIRHKSSETDLVKSAGDRALGRFKEASGHTSEIEYVGDLPEEGSGGVIGSVMSGRIKMDDTLDERLEILEEKMLPEIRTDLFGKNENRKFYNVSGGGFGRAENPFEDLWYLTDFQLPFANPLKLAVIVSSNQ